MNGASFPLRVITPQHLFEREASYLRLRDRTGFFGIMRGHTTFLTLLVTALHMLESSKMFTSVSTTTAYRIKGSTPKAAQMAFLGSPSCLFWMEI